MYKHFFLLLALLKIYEDLKDKYDAMRLENEALMSQLDGKGGNSDSYSVANLRKEIEKLQAEKSRLAMDLKASESNFKRLKDLRESWLMRKG